MNNEQKILYETYRLQMLNLIITLSKDNPEKWEEYKSLAYALQHRIYPYLQTDVDSIFDNFDECVYIVNGEKIEYLLNYLNDIELNNNSITFYDIEKMLLAKNMKRYEIINSLVYFYLDGRFHDIYKKLNDNCGAPAEATFLTGEINFNIGDINII